MEQEDIMDLYDTLGMLDAVAPDDAAALLRQLDQRLVEVMCHAPVPESVEQGIAQGVAYHLLRDRLARRAAGVSGGAD
jgi:uncharacterized protein (DUF2236 family)